MNPGRLIVGECRGGEVRELLMAMNTGHSGGGGTIHANSAADVPARLAALGALAAMSPEAVFLQAASALDVVIHLTRWKGHRVVAEIAVVEWREGRLDVATAIALAGPALRVGVGALVQGPAWPALAEKLGLAPDTSSRFGDTAHSLGARP